jgi:beta-N-acetylhexosaminidase
MITRCHFGNAFLSKNDVLDMTPDQVATLTNQLQEKVLKQNQIPMLIFIDQEGGLVNRLKNKFKTFPSQEQMAKETPVMMEQAARITAKQLNAVGINVNLAPVIDVGYNRASHIFKSHRSFSDNPQKVTQCAKIYIRSFLEEQIIACVKHFPNDGDLDEDPHYGLPVNRKSKEELLNTSLVPYRELNHDGLLRMLMISHVLVPALEPDPNIPVSLSKNTIENFLRKELGFQGLVVTDVMNMKALGEGKFLTEQQIRDKVVKAVEAGANLLLFAGPVREQIAAYEELGHPEKTVNCYKH